MKARVGQMSVLVHLASFVVNAVGIFYDFNYTYLPIYSAFGGRARFLTRLTAIFCLIYTGFALFADVSYLTRSDKGRQPTLVHLRDFLYTTVAFPLCVVVPAMFWGIAAVDLDGLVPLEHRKVIPVTGLFNHFLHTWPLIFCTTCTSLVYHGYPKRSKGLMTIGVIALTYVAWICVIRFYDGVWVYRFLGNLSVAGFLLFMGGTVGVAISAYFIGERLNNFAWKHLKEG